MKLSSSNKHSFKENYKYKVFPRAVIYFHVRTNNQICICIVCTSSEPKINPSRADYIYIEM